MYVEVDDDREEALLAAEVLVDDLLAHSRSGSDLLDRGAVVPAFCEQLAAHVEELLAPLLAGHAYARAPVVLRGRHGRKGRTASGWRPVRQRGARQGARPSASARRGPTRPARTSG